MNDPVIRTMPLGPQWPTLDPFLFCAHHRDAYPAGNGDLAPAAALTGRRIGQDFANIDGWNMYHGQTVPGFPQHPHRGFETISYMREGWMDHADSLGAAARFGQGDVQWMTAGEGIVHSEMFPLFADDAANPLEMFQIWLNLPSANKMVPAHFSMLWSPDIGKYRSAGVDVTVIAGDLADANAPQPPPHSWASGDNDVAIWHLTLEPAASWQLPAAAAADTQRTLYVFSGGGLRVGDHEVPAGNGAVVHCHEPVRLTDTGAGVEVMVLQGRPINEPVAQYGPFVMNDEAGIRQAITDYQTTQFGGWPWPEDAPVHGREIRRFARHADGRLEEFLAS